MQLNGLKQAWRIWISPCLLWYVHFSVLLFLFSNVEPLVANDVAGIDRLENMLVFAGGGEMLAVCYIIMMRHERVRQVRVRRRTRWAVASFAAVYVAYTLCVVCDLAKDAWT